MLPIIEPGTFELAIIDTKAQWSYQVKLTAGCGAQARYVAGIRRNLRFDQHHVKRDVVPYRAGYSILRLHGL